MVMLGVIALLVFGPSRLPEIAKAAGEGLRTFRKAAQDLKDEVRDAIEAEDEEQKKKSEEEDEDKPESSVDPELMPEVRTLPGGPEAAMPMLRPVTPPEAAVPEPAPSEEPAPATRDGAG